MASRSVSALTAAALFAIAMLTGCGAVAPDPPTPSARAAVGGYRLTTVITKSTIPANAAGASSRVSTDLFLTCADSSCSTLLQRAASTDQPQGATVLLSPGPGRFHGAHLRVGVCGGSVNGSFGESYTWTWTPRSDGSLTGTLHQVFNGCGLDGTTTFTATATPVASLPLPYLPSAAARRLVAQINAYDTELSKVYVSGSECNVDPRTTTVAEARCFARTYAAWHPDIDRLAIQVAHLRTAVGACASAVRAVQFSLWSKAVTRAATAYAGARNAAAVKAAVAAEQGATTIATAQHARLVTVVAMCVNPIDAPRLGTHGQLELDPNSVLQPLAD